MTPVAVYTRFYANTEYDAKDHAVIPHVRTINARFEQLKVLIREAAGASTDPKIKEAAALVTPQGVVEPASHRPEFKAAAAIGFQD